VIEGKAHSPQPVLLDWEIPLFERFGHVEPAPRVELDELLEDGDLLGWERPAQVVAAPGHTAGSIAIFFSDDHVLIAGDAITTMSGEPAIGVFNADPEQARESVRRLTRLDASILCVGHGPPITVDAQARIARATYVGASPETRGIG
jgi:glyoxylase-like metal-dependent hydrolase (beta-lactamase superfamily II)